MSKPENAKREPERVCDNENLNEGPENFEKRARQCDADAAKLKRKIADADRKADEVRIHMLDP